MYETITPNLMVESVKDTLTFYKEVLGFTVITTVPGEEDDQFAIIAKDQIMLMLQNRASMIAEYETLAQDKIQPMLTLYICVDQLQALYDELKEKVTFAKELHQTPYGKWEFAIFDNNGKILTLAAKD